MKWSDLYLFYAKIRRIRLKENTYVIWDQDTIKISAL
jgi:hypothetical protein